MKRIILSAFLALACLCVACTPPSSSDEPYDDNKVVGSITFPGDVVPKPVLGSGSSSCTITFTATAVWNAEIASARSDGWCSVSPARGEAGDVSVTISAKENITPEDRSAVVRITCGEAQEKFTVTQKQKNALTVTESRFEIGPEGGDFTIEVKANVDYEYRIDESASSWITSNSTKVMESSELTFHVAGNDGTDTREGIITIFSGDLTETITVFQQGTKPSIVLGRKEYSVGSSESVLKIELSSNVDVYATLPDTDWIRENSTKSISAHTFVFDISENHEYDSRKAEIIFSDKDKSVSESVIITQMQKDAIILTENEYIIEGEGGTFELGLNTNVEFEVRVSEPWIKYIKTKGLHSEVLTFNIAANDAENAVERECNITFSSANVSQTITVRQKVKEPPVPTDAIVADVLAGNEGSLFRVSGYINNITNNTYGNYYLKDYSGELYIYGTLDSNGQSKKFAEMGIENGDIITVSGPKKIYNATHELVDVTVENHIPVSDLTVSEFLSMEISDAKYYRLTGTVTNLTNTDYGNFDLVDETGSVYVYGVLSGWGGPKEQFRELGIIEGDLITIVGVRGEYKGKDEVLSAFYVSHELGGTDDGGNSPSIDPGEDF